MAYNHRYAEASKLFRDVIEKESNSEGQGNRCSVWYSLRLCGSGCQPPR